MLVSANSDRPFSTVEELRIPLEIPPVLLSVTAGMQTLPHKRGSDTMVKADESAEAGRPSVRITSRVSRAFARRDITSSL